MEEADAMIQGLLKEYGAQLDLYSNMRDSARQLQHLCREGDFRDGETIKLLDRFLETRRLQMQSIEESQGINARTFETLKVQLGLEEVTGKTLVDLCPTGETRRLQEVIDSLELLLREIVSLDADSQKHLNYKLSSLKEEALELRKGRRASQAYRDPAPVHHQGTFLDHKKN